MALPLPRPPPHSPTEYLAKEKLCQLQYNGGALLFSLTPELQQAFHTEGTDNVVGRLIEKAEVQLSHLVLHKG